MAGRCHNSQVTTTFVRATFCGAGYFSFGQSPNNLRTCHESYEMKEDGEEEREKDQGTVRFFPGGNEKGTIPHAYSFQLSDEWGKRNK